MIDEYAIDVRSFSQIRHDQRRDDEGLPPDSQAGDRRCEAAVVRRRGLQTCSQRGGST